MRYRQVIINQSQNLITGTLSLTQRSNGFFRCGNELILSLNGCIQSGLCEVINRTSDGGITALHMAALNAHVESVQLLLDLGASVSEVTVEDGTTIDLIGNCLAFLFHGVEWNICFGNLQYVLVD